MIGVVELVGAIHVVDAVAGPVDVPEVEVVEVGPAVAWVAAGSVGR